MFTGFFEVLTHSMAAANLPYTILLGMVVLYWLLYILGAVGEDLLDFAGLDLDADVDVDIDADVDLDVGGVFGGGFLNAFLVFFHVGQVPVVLILSVFIVCMWTISMVATRLLGNAASVVAAMLVVPVVFAGLMATKALVMPFAPFLKKVFDQSSDKVEIIGKTCVICSLEASESHGQAEFTMDGAPLLLNVKTKEGETLKQGEEAIVYGFDKEKNIYLISGFNANEPNQTEEQA